MTTRATALVVLVILLVGTDPRLSAAAQGSSPRPIRWLAAGDSYSAGEGLPDTSEPTCQRAFRDGSHKSAAWAQIARERLADQVPTAATTAGQKGFDFVACTGAVTEDLFDDKAGKKEWDERNNGRFDLVTFSFGGNNIGFDDIIEQCIGVDAATAGASAGAFGGGGAQGALTGAAAAWLVKGGCPSESDIRRRVDDLGRSGNTVDVRVGNNAEKRSLRGYQQFLIDVANRVAKPGGKIVVVGYPALVEEAKFWPAPNKAFGICQGIRTGDAAVLRGAAGLLNQTIGEAVKQVSAQRPNGVTLTFVDVNTGNEQVGFTNQDLFEPSSGPRHNLCAAKPWMNGLTTGLFSGAEFRPQRSFHPTQEGHTHQGKLVADRIKELFANDKKASETTASETKPNRSSKGVTISGRFETTATAASANTLSISYKIEELKLGVNVANAPPGKAVLSLTGSGSATITNTTPGRNTAFDLLEPMQVIPYWDKDAHGDVFSGFCSNLVFRGRTYCGVGRIVFDSPSKANSLGFTTLAPGEAVSMPALRSDPYEKLQPILAPESSVKALQQLVLSTPPDLVSVASGATRLPKACTNSTLALLTGAGAPLTQPSNSFIPVPCNRI